MEQIGRYLIQNPLGEGAMGQVLRARDPSFGRDVAVKLLHPRYARDPALRQRFLREAQTLAALEHPAVVPVYDFGESGELVWLVMRLMDGGSLADRLAKGALKSAEIRLVMERIGSALDAAHAQGLIHRDVKPGNILYDRYGQPYLADFGIVKLAASSSTLTMDSILGTPAYMSPEQVQGNPPPDGRSDLYSLGIVLFEMLTGRVPYQSDTALSTAMQHVLAPVPQLSDFRPGMAQWQPLLDRALAKRPEHRFQTGQELAAAAGAGLRDRHPPAVAAAKKRAFPLWAVVIPGVVALMLLFIFLSGSSGSRGNDSFAAVPLSQTTAALSALVNHPASADSATRTPTRRLAIARSTATLIPTLRPTQPLVPTDAPTRTPAPPVILLAENGPWHLGDEEFARDSTGTAWEKLTGLCLKLPFSLRQIPDRLTLHYEVYGSEVDNQIVLNDRVIGTVPRQIAARAGDRPNYWSDPLSLNINPALLQIGRNHLEFCAVPIIEKPDFPGDHDDWRVRNVRLVAERTGGRE